MRHVLLNIEIQYPRYSYDFNIRLNYNSIIRQNGGKFSNARINSNYIRIKSNNIKPNNFILKIKTYTNDIC